MTEAYERCMLPNMYKNRVRYHITAVNYSSKKNKMREGKRKKREREELYNKKDLLKKRKQIPSKKLRCGVFY